MVLVSDEDWAILITRPASTKPLVSAQPEPGVVVVPGTVVTTWALLVELTVVLVGGAVVEDPAVSAPAQATTAKTRTTPGHAFPASGRVVV